MSRCRRVALQYAESGVPTFPCEAGGKRPVTARGFHDASTDFDQIERWFRASPTANLAMPTGARSGLLVVDIDLKHGADGRATLAAVEARLGVLPPTLVSATPSGGEHRWFAMPTATIRSSAGRLAGEDAPGLDIRAEGGYVLVSPSTIDGRSYAWSERRPVADLPEAWIVALTPAERPTVTAPAWAPADTREQGSSLRWTTAALQRAARELASAPRGTRNDRLWRAAAALGGLLHLGGIDAADVRTALLWACSSWGERDTAKDAATLERALAWGRANPRNIDLSDRSAA